MIISTAKWFSWRGLTAIGRIAANHSVWDLEIENLSSFCVILCVMKYTPSGVRRSPSFCLSPSRRPCMQSNCRVTEGEAPFVST